MDDVEIYPAPVRDNLITVAAIGVLAFIATDIAHEVIGHGVGLILAGGRSGVLTTTRLIYAAQLPAPRWRIFDLGGPLGNLAWASLCLALQRIIRGAASRLRLFLWTTAMFSLFWEFGYLLKCAISGNGDGMALIDGLKPAALWRGLLFVAGLMLYRGAIRLLASELHFVVRLNDSRWRGRVSRLLWTIYLAGGLTACAGALFDPRGAAEIFNSAAMTSFIACAGLALVPRLFANYADRQSSSASIFRSVALTIFAGAALLFFVLVLGPGIRV